MTFTTETVFAIELVSETGERVITPTFEVCNIALSLGIACPQANLWVCYRSNNFPVRDTADQVVATNELINTLKD